jgi:hypothetical protein
VDIVRILRIMAVMLLAIAVYFLWAANKDGVFVALVLAACAYFLTVRFRAKRRIDERRATEAKDALRDDESSG